MDDWEAIRAFLTAPTEQKEAFWESSALIWIDWGEYDEDILCYCNEKLPDTAKIDFACVDTDKKRGIDILLKKNGSSTAIPYAEDRLDRDTTLRSVQAYLAPDYRLRWYLGSLGSDTLAFCLLLDGQWRQLEEEFGAALVERYFLPVQADSKMFDLEADEAAALLERLKGQ